MMPIVYVIVDKDGMLPSTVYFSSREQANEAMSIANTLVPGHGFKVVELRSR